ncbi:MAG: gamma-glutamylcyclotransferase family protein [Solirubrobacteraceae bacterium]
MNAQRQFVFGYGSLVAENEGCHVATLCGHRRSWAVAMDNRVDVPGYKFYRLRCDGSRPQVFVCFLDIEADLACAVTGICMPVGERGLRRLDDRERNYDRIDVTAEIDGARGRVWAYRGSDAGRARLRDGRALGLAVASRDYLDGVLDAIAAIAPDEVASVQRSPAALDLERIEIP